MPATLLWERSMALAVPGPILLNDEQRSTSSHDNSPLDESSDEPPPWCKELPKAAWCEEPPIDLTSPHPVCRVLLAVIGFIAILAVAGAIFSR